MNPTDPAPLGEGEMLYRLATRLYPICRSLTGPGVRETLAILGEHLPDLQIHEVPTGTRAFDWTVPREWRIRDAYIADVTGQRVVDFRTHNLHVVGYSTPIDADMDLTELEPHLHSLPDQPDAIPYVTSYYAQDWGFCLTDRVRRELRPGTYRVVIDSELLDGHLTYGELILPGLTGDEVLLSTYICHPSMANNELSGPVVTSAIADWLRRGGPRRFTYRIVFVPETIGSLVYLSRHLEDMCRRTVAGFVITCIGDDRTYSLLHSRRGGTLADRVATCVLAHHHPGYRSYPFLERGSDERQYCAPGIDLPVVSLMRSKYGTYPEYHTSLDDLDLISPAGLAGGFAALRRCLECLEANRRYRVTCLGEPQLGKRGLYPQLSTRGSARSVKTMTDIMAYCDGEHDLIELSTRIGVPPWEIIPILSRLEAEGLLAAVA